MTKAFCSVTLFQNKGPLYNKGKIVLEKKLNNTPKNIMAEYNDGKLSEAETALSLHRFIIENSNYQQITEGIDALGEMKTNLSAQQLDMFLQRLSDTEFTDNILDAWVNNGSAYAIDCLVQYEFRNNGNSAAVDKVTELYHIFRDIAEASDKEEIPLKSLHSALSRFITSGFEKMSMDSFKEYSRSLDQLSSSGLLDDKTAGSKFNCQISAFFNDLTKAMDDPEDLKNNIRELSKRHRQILQHLEL